MNDLPRFLSLYNSESVEIDDADVDDEEIFNAVPETTVGQLARGDSLVWDNNS